MGACPNWWTKFSGRQLLLVGSQRRCARTHTRYKPRRYNSIGSRCVQCHWADAFYWLALFDNRQALLRSASPAPLQIAKGRRAFSCLYESSVTPDRQPIVVSCLYARISQSFACKPKDWGCANIGALMTWRSMCQSRITKQCKILSKWAY